MTGRDRTRQSSLPHQVGARDCSASEGDISVADAICDATKRLRAAGVESPRRDARLLLADAMGQDAALLAPSGAVPVAVHAQFADGVARRAAREPIARIRGTREFWGMDFALSAATLDPRPDSETIVEAALEAVADRDAPIRVLDLGTGSGCLLCAVLSELRHATGVGIDRSFEAAVTARRNADALGVGERAHVVVGDWGTRFAGRFDLVVANPPYVPTAAIAALAPEVAAFDPRLALDGGADGLDAYRVLIPALPRLLTPAGTAVLEVGAGQSKEVRALFGLVGLDFTGARADLSAIERALSVRLEAG